MPRPIAARQQRQAGDIAGLALVGAHAERRVALDVLDRGEALARRQRDIGGGHVVVQIDKGCARPRRRGRQQQPGRRLGVGATAGSRRLAAGQARKPPRRGAPPRRLSARHSAEREAAARRADAVDRWRRPSSGTKAASRSSKRSRPCGLGEQMQGRVPAARHREQVAIDRDARCRPPIAVAAAAAPRRSRSAGRRRRDDRMAGIERHAGDRATRRLARLGAQIDDRRRSRPRPRPAPPRAA